MSGVVDALVGAMVGVALPVPDVVDGSGGVYPQSPEPDRRCFLFDLRGGAQHPPQYKFEPGRSGVYRDRSAARSRRRRESPVRFL